MTHLPKRVLLGAGLTSSTLSAVFMSAALYSLLPGAWAYCGLLIGVILEVVKSALSYESASCYLPERRYGAFVGAVLIIIAVMLFSTWAGNERLIHSVAADEKQGEALRGTRSEQIISELKAIDLQLADLAKPYLVNADTKHEREMLKGLQSQAKAMRDRMALTKAAEMESGVIADLLATIAKKEEAVATDNRRETERRQALERDLRATMSTLHAEQVEIAARTSKIESSDTAVTYLILKVIVLVIEGFPIYYFCVYGAPAKARQFSKVDQVEEGSEPVAKPVQEPVPAIAAAVVEDLPTPILDQVADDSLAAPVEASVDEVADTPAVVHTQAATPAFSHPKLDQVLSSVMGMSSGEPVTTAWLKATFNVGGDSATDLTRALHDAGLIVKPGKSWIRA